MLQPYVEFFCLHYEDVDTEPLGSYSPSSSPPPPPRVPPFHCDLQLQPRMLEVICCNPMCTQDK